MPPQQQGQLRPVGEGVATEEFGELAALFTQAATAASTSDPHRFRVGYCVRGGLVAVGEVGSAAALLAVLRAMEQLPHWEARVHGAPEDMLDCDLLFTRLATAAR